MGHVWWKIAYCISAPTKLLPLQADCPSASSLWPHICCRAAMLHSPPPFPSRDRQALVWPVALCFLCCFGVQGSWCGIPCKMRARFKKDRQFGNNLPNQTKQAPTIRSLAESPPPLPQPWSSLRIPVQRPQTFHRQAGLIQGLTRHPIYAKGLSMSLSLLLNLLRFPSLLPPIACILKELFSALSDPGFAPPALVRIQLTFLCQCPAAGNRPRSFTAQQKKYRQLTDRSK